MGARAKSSAPAERLRLRLEKKLEMLEAEMNAVFETNMDLWNKFFGMMDKQPDMDMTYADYLTEQLEMAKEKFTEEEYKLLQQDIETIRGIDERDRQAGRDVRAGRSYDVEYVHDGRTSVSPNAIAKRAPARGTCDCMKDKM